MSWGTGIDKLVADRVGWQSVTVESLANDAFGGEPDRRGGYQ
jgi:hypothetical protein